MEAILFYVFGFGALASALCVVFPPVPGARDPIHSAIAMVVTFFFVAALYAMLSAHLIAVLQILVYAGAIMVLFVFVIMLLNLQSEQQEKVPLRPMQIVGGLLAASTTFGIVSGLRHDDFLAPISAQLVEAVKDPATYGSLKEIGRLMLNRYLLPFELTSVLLLVAIIGAVIVAKREPRSTYLSEALKQSTFRERHGKHIPAGFTSVGGGGTGGDTSGGKDHH